MTNHDEIYRLAEFYDIAFDFRDLAEECDFLTEVVRRHLGRPPGSFLELAAGPGNHVIEFARRGVRAAGLDLSQHMVDYGLEKAIDQGVRIEYFCGDMVNFLVPGHYDLVALLMDSASYLLDNDAFLKNLNCVADHLIDGGMYILEIVHPRDVLTSEKSTGNKWEMERDGKKVRMEWGSDQDPFDPTTQITEVSVVLHYEDDEGSGTVTDKALQRCFVANECKALVKASGRFSIVDIFGSMSMEIPFTNEKTAWRMVPVLQKIS